MKVAGAHAHSSQGKSLLPPALIVAALSLLYELTFLCTTHSANLRLEICLENSGSNT